MSKKDIVCQTCDKHYYVEEDICWTVTDDNAEYVICSKDEMLKHIENCPHKND